MSDLIVWSPNGLYLPEADVFIDPWKPVHRAIITHAHSDHARPGHQYYLAEPVTASLIKHRLGSQTPVETLHYKKSIRINGVNISFYPAGHIPGASQVRIERRGEVWVVSGDYKRHIDGISRPFEPVACHTFVTESTFALPIFQWQEQEKLAENLQSWVSQKLSEGVHVLISAYSIGKAQRVIKILNSNWIVPFVHKSIFDLQMILRELKVFDGNYAKFSDYKKHFGSSVFIIPPAADSRLPQGVSGPYVHASCSGWMTIRGLKRRQNLDRGFPISDHADWPSLLSTIQETGASRIIAMHGFAESLARYLTEKEIKAEVFSTYSTEQVEFES